jgi:hemoglobin/transferrin/lactoferrin receptor protein
MHPLPPIRKGPLPRRRLLACAVALVTGTAAAVTQADPLTGNDAPAPQQAATGTTTPAGTAAQEATPPSGALPRSQAETPSRRAIDNIVVTATRLDTRLADSARSIAVIDRLAIESMQAQSVAQTLLYEPNITVAGGPRAASQAVNIRGLSGNKVLQTIDGARQSFESGHRPSYFLDPELLASVEAVRGPVSSLWGSGALGGVVAQRTLRADDYLDDSERLGGFVKSGYNSNNRQQTTTAALLGRAGDSDWLLSAYTRDSDDVELGNGDRLEGSASENAGILAKLNTRLGDIHSVEFIYRGAQFEGAVPSNGTAELNGSSNFLLEREQVTHNGSVEYRYRPESDWVDAQVLAYVNRVDMDESRVTDGRADSTVLETWGLNLSNRAQLGRVDLLLGLDSYRESFSAERRGLNRPVPPTAESTVWSLYAQSRVELSDSWRLDLGLRYDDFSTEAENLDDRRQDSALSPSLALRYAPADWLSLTLRHDRAFRAPSAEELYSTGAHFCLSPGFCNRFEPNPELDAERAANTELLARMEFAGPLGGDRLWLEASVFENRVDDFIEQIVAGPTFFGRPNPGSTTWINVDEARLRGAELAASYQRGGLNLRLAYGLTRGEDQNTGQDLTNIPADTFNADLSYAFASRSLLAGLRLTHALDQDRTDVPELAPGTVFDNYTVADLYASWTPQALPAVRLDLNVNNLGDEFYQRAWDQLPQAGREVIVSARYRF